MSDPAPMPAWKRAAVTAGVAAFVLCSGVDVATGGEHWPFSAYAMYATIKEDYRARKFYLIGIPESGGRFPLYDRQYLEPLNRVGLHTAILRLTQRGISQKRIRALVQDVADRYESRRLAGAHDGPKLRSVQLWRFVWDLDPTLANLDKPEEADLILEVRPAARGAE